ncbi:class I SAM-dependent methyltransferase, partial [Mesorhizobium sp. M00.F.Ca.ET.186.01.1.1]
MRDVPVKPEPRVLELGAGTGFLTRLLLTMYQGSGVLVDNCQTSFDAYNQVAHNHADRITYLLEDLFTLKLTETFDLVCSFGLIEHFKEKAEILSIHKQFCKEDGYLILIVPPSLRFQEHEFKTLSTYGKLEGANLLDWPVTSAE